MHSVWINAKEYVVEVKDGGLIIIAQQNSKGVLVFRLFPQQ